MKKGIHPENYRPVVFKDMSNGDMFLSRSTCATKDTIEFEGETLQKTQLNSKVKLTHWLSWKSLTLLIRSTLVSLSWLTQQDVLISS